MTKPVFFQQTTAFTIDNDLDGNFKIITKAFGYNVADIAGYEVEEHRHFIRVEKAKNHYTLVKNAMHLDLNFTQHEPSWGKPTGIYLKCYRLYLKFKPDNMYSVAYNFFTEHEANEFARFMKLDPEFL